MKRSAFVALSAAGLGLVLAAPAPVSALNLGGPRHAKVGDAVQYSPGDPTIQARQVLFRTQDEPLAAYRKVVVPTFQVQFVTRSAASAGHNVSVKVTYNLDGLDPAVMQAITDAIYARFNARLAAAGYTVLPQEAAAQASAAYAKVLAHAKPGPQSARTANGATSTFFAPTGRAMYTVLGDTELGGMANFGDRSFLDERQAARDLDAMLLGARFTVTFVQQKSNRGVRFLGVHPAFAKIKSDVAIQIEPVATHLWVITPGSKASLGAPADRLRFELNAPVLIPGDAVQAVRNTTTTGQKVSDAAVNLIGAFSGSGFGSKTKDMTVTVKPDAYRAEVGEALAGMSDIFVAQLNSAS